MADKTFTSISDSRQDRKTVFRTPKKRNYIAIGNHLAQDSNLSLEARGLMLLVLSLPEDWEFRFDWMCRQAGVGKDKLQRILKELENHGYLIREVFRTAGRFASSYRFHEFPTEPEKPQRFSRNGSAGAENNAPYKERRNKKQTDKVAPPLEVKVEGKEEGEATTTTKTRAGEQNGGGGGALPSPSPDSILQARINTCVDQTLPEICRLLRYEESAARDIPAVRVIALALSRAASGYSDLVTERLEQAAWSLDGHASLADLRRALGLDR